MSAIPSKFLAWGICAALAFSATAAHAADDVLKLVPDEALGVVVVHRMSETNDKLRALALQLKVPPFDLLATAKLSLGVGQGLDEQGSVALAAVPGSPNGAPVMVAFVAASDPEALAEQLNAEIGDDGVARLSLANRPVVAAAKDGYVVITEEANKPTLLAVLASDKNVADAAPALATWSAAQDALALTTPAGVKFAQQQIQFGLQMAKAQLEQQGEQGKTALAGLGMYDGLIAAMDKEIQHAAIGLRVADDGAVHVASRTVPVAGGALAGLAAQAKPIRNNPLAGLPQSPYFIAGGGVFTPASMKPWMDASFGMMRAYPGWDKLSEQDLKKLSKISLQSMRGVRSMALMLGVGQADEPLYSRMLSVLKTKDANTYLENYEATVGEMAKILEQTGQPLWAFESKRIEIDGLPVLQLSMDMTSFIAAGQSGPEVEKMMELMFGAGGKMNSYFAAADQTTIVAAYVSPDQLVAAVRALRSGDPRLADEATVAQTLAMLPPGAQWVGLVRPRGGVEFVSRMMKAVQPAGAPGVVPEIPEFPETPPVGFGALLSPSGLDTDLVIPAAVLEAVSEVVRQAIAERSKPQA